MRRFLPALLSGLLTALAPAQPANSGTRQVRFLPVGDAPPFRQEVRDDVRYELEPPAGTVPPTEVMLAFDDTAATSTPLRLGRLSAPLKAPPGGGPLILRKPGEKSDSEPWLRVQRPETGDFLVLLWREPKAASWDKARALVMADDPVTMPAGTLRIVNLAPFQVAVSLGSEKWMLEGGKTVRRILPVGTPQPFALFLADTSGNPKRLYAADVLHNAGERGLAVIYLADGENPRRPVKVTVQREPVAAVPAAGR